MQWSKLKKRIEENFADSIKKRVQIYTTRYSIASHFMVRSWITVDGIEIANFSNPDNTAKFGWNTPEIDKRRNNIESKEIVEKGEFSTWDFVNSCFEFVNSPFDESLESENPIIQGFAVLDKRCGKKRLKNFIADGKHPLVRHLFDFRIKCELFKVPE